MRLDHIIAAGGWTTIASAIADVAPAVDALPVDWPRLGVAGGVLAMVWALIRWIRRRLNSGQLRILLQSEDGEQMRKELRRMQREISERDGRIAELIRQRDMEIEERRAWQQRHLAHLDDEHEHKEVSHG